MAVAAGLMVLSAGIASACEPAGPLESVRILGVDFRGDIRLGDGRTIRLAGIAWPSAAAPAARRTLAAHVAAMTVGDDAGVVALGQPDRWGRVSAQVFAGKEWVQGRLVEDGLALAWPEPAARGCWAELLERDMLARDGGLGVWSALGRRLAGLRLRDAASAGMSHRIVYEGRVRSVRPGRTITFVNFDGPRGKTPTLFIARRLSAEFARMGRDVATFSGKRLRVRAEFATAPALRLTVASPDGVEILD